MTGNERTVRRGRLGLLAVSFMALWFGACDLTIERLGVGEECRRDKDCLEGLSCVNRECAAPPVKGDPKSVTDDPVCVVGDTRPVCQPDAGG